MPSKPPEFLDAQQLQAFVAVLSTGSMTGAAKALNKSQSVVTRLIQELERALGFSLLHRNGPRIAPTEQAIAFLGEAELYLGGLRAIGERARHIRERSAKPMTLAAIPALATSLVPLALAEIEQQNFPGRVTIQSTSAETVVQAVIARTAEIGVASLPLENAGVEVHWIGEVPCVAVVAAGDALAGRDELRPSDFAGRRLIVPANPYRLRPKIDEALASYSVVTGGRIESNATYVSIALARAGLGVAIVEPLTLSGLNPTGVIALPLTFRVPFRWGVISAMGVPLSPNAQTMITALERHAALLRGFLRIRPGDTLLR